MSDYNSANDQMLEVFVFEMTTLIEQLDEILLASEKNQRLTDDDVAEVFRIMHTIKGSSAMMEFNVISTVTHRLEDSFFIIRDKGIEESHFTELFDLMLDATDFLKSQLDAIQNGNELAVGNDELIARAEKFYAVLSGKETSSPVSKPSAKNKKPAARTLEPQAESPAISCEPAYQVDVLFEEDCGMENLRSFMLINNLKEKCEILSYSPGDIETNPESATEILMNGFTVILRTKITLKQLRNAVEGSMHVKSAVITPLKEYAADSDIRGGKNRFDLHVMFEENLGMENLRSLMLVNTLRAQSNVISFSPPDIEKNPDTANSIQTDGFIIALETDLSEPELQKLLDNAMHVRKAVLTPVFPPQSEVETAPLSSASSEPGSSETMQQTVETYPLPDVQQPVAKKAPAATSNKPVKQNLINVNLSKLDALMDLMGELVITESMVTRNPDLQGIGHLDNFNKSARQLRKLTDELQDMVMSIRMVPVAGTFQKMQRIVRDMCRNMGKEVDLITMGEETDIDKTIIDGIGDPIMHLVRNSMDHGVETPAEREAAGKPRKATIALSAQNTGDEILITVSDDGKGLDAEKLLEKARKSNLLSKPISDYTEKEAFQMLMLPGFSTKESVTEYSGRGVGMDVVKKNIEKVGGSVHIESKRGYGMSVFLKIPLTLAIVDGMDISVGGGIYTLQITSINESFKAAQDQVVIDTDGNEMIVIRGNIYPIIRLYELYNIPDAHTNIEDGILIWVQTGDRSACLFVDQLIGEQQIVVKPLPKFLARYDVKPWGISGCTILGDGNISLILDVGSIIDKIMEKR